MTAILVKKTVAALAGIFCLLTPCAALAKVESNLSFVPAAVPAGKPARASIVVQNSDAAIGTGLNFSLALPEGIEVQGSGNLSSTCGGTPVLGNQDGAVRLSLTNGQVPAASGDNPGTCSLSFDVRGMRRDTFVVSIPVGAIKATFGGITQSNGNAAQSSLDVTMSAITINVKSPETASAKGGQIIPHRYIFTNRNDIPVTGMDLDVDMSVISNTWRAVGDPVENTCGGSFSISQLPPVLDPAHWHSATKVSLRDGIIPARSTCTLTYLVTPNRVSTSFYLGNGISRRLPAELIRTDQGVSNEISSDEWAMFRGGIQSKTLVNGRAQGNLGLLHGEEADLTIELLNSSVFAVSGLVIPVPIPPAIHVLDITSTCGSVEKTSSGFTWRLELPGAPPEPTVDFETSNCMAKLRVRATQAGNYKVTFLPAYYSGYHIMGSSAEITASSSPIGAEGGFDKDQIYAADSSIFSVRLTNRSATETLQNVTFNNPIQSQIHGAVIGVDGVTQNSCTGALVDISPDRSGIRFSGITLAPSASCELAYQVTFGSGAIDRISSMHIQKTNKIGQGDITYRSAGGEQLPWGSELYDHIGVRMSLEIQGWIAPQSASEGSQARMVIQVVRLSEEGHGMRDMGMRLSLADGIVIDSNPNLSSACGGRLLSGPGSAVFHLVDAEMLSYPPEPGVRHICKIEVNVRLPRLAEGETSRFITSTFEADHSLGTRRGFWAQDANVEGPAGYVPVAYSPMVRVSIAKFDLGIGLEFADAAVGGSGTTRMLVSLSNQSNTGLHLSDVALDVDLSGTGVRLAAVPDPRCRVKSGGANACNGGQFTVLPSGLRLSGATISGGAICQMEFTVTAGSGGNHIITIPARAVTTNQGVTNPSGVYATLTAAYVLSASVGFDPNLIGEGGETDFIIEIINAMADDGNSDFNGKGVSITQEIPSWASVAGSPRTNCQGASTNVFMGRLLLNYGKFPASSSCYVSVPIRIAASGSYQAVLPAGSIQTLESVTNTAAFTAAVRVLKAPILTVARAPGMTGARRPGAATLRIQNPNPAALNPEGFSGLALAIEAQAPLELLGPSTVSTCSGYSQEPSSHGINIHGITLPAAGSCEVTLSARADAPGLHQSRAGGMTVQQIDIPAAPSVALAWRVVADPAVRLSVLGDNPDSELPFRLGIEIENPNDVPVGVIQTGLALKLPSAPGEMVLGQVQPLLSACGTVALSAPAGSSSLALAGGTLAAKAKCQIEVSLIGEAGGEYVLRPSPLVLEYGSVIVDPLTITLLSTHADLTASRTMRVLAQRVEGVEACAALNEAEPGAYHALPGACVEVTVAVESPVSEKKVARDIAAREIIGDNLAIASIDTGSFDGIKEVSGALEAEIAAISPGETKSFSYRAVLQ